MLCQAARETGGVAIQNRGTLGGNIANASPAADSPPALLAYGAELELVSSRGSRWVPYDGFHTGYKKTILAPGEIVARVRLPRRFGERVHQYRKVGPRRAQAISKVCFAACADVDAGKIVDVRIAIGGVAPIVPRCAAVERVLRDEGVGVDALARAKAALATAIAPIDDVRSTARYRRKVAENLLVDFVLKLRHDVGA
jgi:CO/xanthine dehydrogenase FAD-binding subunit